MPLQYPELFGKHECGHKVRFSLATATRLDPRAKLTNETDDEVAGPCDAEATSKVLEIGAKSPETRQRD